MKKLIIVSAALVSGAAFAQAPSRAPAADDDPSGTICRIITETGSRLNRSRVCKTRAEWAEWRREMRENTDRTQMRRVHEDNN
jgi:hypothetical protein